ncbi:MAG: hypothetical protein M0Z41_03425 [Peptococcaceae bacterium]|jgi:DNA-binding transcriptional ArsR family regulator|nr:hypothetical protein [Peptococcaceae bacterium]
MEKEADQYKPTRAECREVADFLQGFSNPVRVEIMCALRDGPVHPKKGSVCVGEINPVNGAG